MLIRIAYRKTREGRFLSHLDSTHSWERSIRRAGLPLAYSQGFNPHPKITFASALAVGTTSDSEYMDLELSEELAIDEVEHRLKAGLAPAFQIVSMRVMEGKQEALMSVINAADYRLLVEFVDPVERETIDQAIQVMMAQEEVEVFRFKKNSKEKKSVNIRPGLWSVSADVDGKQAEVCMNISTGSEFNVRPEEVIYGLMTAGMPPVQTILRIHRDGLWIRNPDGTQKTPLD